MTHLASSRACSCLHMVSCAVGYNQYEPRSVKISPAGDGEGGESAGVHESQSGESHRSGGPESGETDVRSGGESHSALWPSSRQVPCARDTRVGGTL